jgi:hypothetical protein
MMSMKELSPSEKEKHQKKLVSQLEALPHFISVIEKLEVGNNISDRSAAMDLVLYTEFKDEAALNEYRVHPEHLKVLDFIKEVVAEARVVDYWY